MTAGLRDADGSNIQAHSKRKDPIAEKADVSESVINLDQKQ